MGYRYLDDVAIADVAFHAWGATVDEVFSQAARATLGVMVEDPGAVEPRLQRRLELEAVSADLLLYDFLSELLYHKDAERLLLLPERVEVTLAAQGARLTAVLAGEEIDRQRHVLLVDVKAVTLHRFALERTAHGWEAEVVLDI